MTTNNTQLGYRKYTIPANGEVDIPVPDASQVRFYESNGAFSVSIDNGELVPFTKGKKFKLPGDDTLTVLKLRDDSGFDNAVSFYFGNVEVEDDTFQVLNGEDLIGPRPDAAELLFDDTIAAAAAEVTVHASSADTAEILAHNYGANPVEIRNGASEIIDVLAAGEKARYIVTAGLKAYSTLGTDLRVSRFFF
ncbi:hypothetical protein [Coraliomargarita parva]|uniref:hypothetical protein n=1 Tax=Coraliomargarita parva TaxID=3014050 RepID=UPI0022B3619A|nr:hypothetical protein [Coraliomargarita parva]